MSGLYQGPISIKYSSLDNSIPDLNRANMLIPNGRKLIQSVMDEMETFGTKHLFKFQKLSDGSVLFARVIDNFGSPLVFLDISTKTSTVKEVISSAGGCNLFYFFNIETDTPYILNHDGTKWKLITKMPEGFAVPGPGGWWEKQPFFWTGDKASDVVIPLYSENGTVFIGKDGFEICTVPSIATGSACLRDGLILIKPRYSTSAYWIDPSKPEEINPCGTAVTSTSQNPYWNLSATLGISQYGLDSVDIISISSSSVGLSVSFNNSLTGYSNPGMQIISLDDENPIVYTTTVAADCTGWITWHELNNAGEVNARHWSYNIPDGKGYIHNQVMDAGFDGDIEVVLIYNEDRNMNQTEFNKVTPDEYWRNYWSPCIYDDCTVTSDAYTGQQKREYLYTIYSEVTGQDSMHSIYDFSSQHTWESGSSRYEYVRACNLINDYSLAITDNSCNLNENATLNQEYEDRIIGIPASIWGGTTMNYSKTKSTAQTNTGYETPATCEQPLTMATYNSPGSVAVYPFGDYKPLSIDCEGSTKWSSSEYIEGYFYDYAYNSDKAAIFIAQFYDQNFNETYKMFGYYEGELTDLTEMVGGERAILGPYDYPSNLTNFIPLRGRNCG